jgi:hypothetical protein
MHASPLAPQATAVGGLTHLPSLPQQPPPQEVPSQMHPPMKQRWPGSHADPPPQLQAPWKHWSAVVALQAVQVTPAFPH